MHPLTTFDDTHHRQFMDQGYVRLGHVLAPDDLAALQQRIDDIMLGRVHYPNMRLQLAGDYNAGPRIVGNTQPTLDYRRIDDLEQDPLFLTYIQHPLFKHIAHRYIGPHVSVFRSMLMNKPAGHSQPLAWHQDVGAGWGIDQNPIVTVWTALDAATAATGCVQIVPGSHIHGIINEKHFLEPRDEPRYAPADAVIDLEAEAGEAVLLHNLLLHRSGANATPNPRRAFSATYMDAATRTRDTHRTFPVIFGQGALDPASVGDKPAELIEKFYG